MDMESNGVSPNQISASSSSPIHIPIPIRIASCKKEVLLSCNNAMNREVLGSFQILHWSQNPFILNAKLWTQLHSKNVVLIWLQKVHSVMHTPQWVFIGAYKPRLTEPKRLGSRETSKCMHKCLHTPTHFMRWNCSVSLQSVANCSESCSGELRCDRSLTAIRLSVE